MIAAILIGREGSVGFPGKNLYPVLGRPLMAYPLLAAVNSKYIDYIYVSTDSEKIKNTALKYGEKIKIIKRPAYLATSKALGEDVFAHGYRYIRKKIKNKIELVVLLFCNTVNILSETIDAGIEILRKNPLYDSAITVSAYNMYSPVRARKIGKNGLLEPFISFDKYEKNMIINCDRDAQGNVYFHDCGVSVVRPRCLEDLSCGILPQKWMGKKIYPMVQKEGLDIDYEWQIPQAENWLKRNGFTKTKTR